MFIKGEISQTPKTPLPVIHQNLVSGGIPLTFFKLYDPKFSHLCAECGKPLRCIDPDCGLRGLEQRGLFVKVSANDGNLLTEYWDIEGPRPSFENMRDLELHQGIWAGDGFRYEGLRPSEVEPHFDIFGKVLIRHPQLLRALTQANLRKGGT